MSVSVYIGESHVSQSGKETGRTVTFVAPGQNGRERRLSLWVPDYVNISECAGEFVSAVAKMPAGTRGAKPASQPAVKAPEPAVKAPVAPASQPTSALRSALASRLAR